MEITREQYNKIVKAIRSAQKPGKCSYEHAGEPCCVIGQLAALEGVSPETLIEWDRMDSSRVTDVLDKYEDLGQEALGEYPLRLLQDLQDHWDDPLTYSLVSSRTPRTLDEQADEIRERLEDYVYRAYHHRIVEAPA